MKNSKTRFYLIKGYQIPLEQIAQKSKVEVVPGAGKKLMLKFGDNTGLTNAEEMSDNLIFFAPDVNSSQYQIMSEIMDVFNLKPYKYVIVQIDGSPLIEFNESDIDKSIDSIKGLAKDDVFAVYEWCFINNPNENPQYIDHKICKKSEEQTQTHFAIIGKKLTLSDLETKTNIKTLLSESGQIRLKKGSNVGLVTLKTTDQNLDYVSADEESDITEMAEEISVCFQLTVVRVRMPIVANPEEFPLNVEFFDQLKNQLCEKIEFTQALLLIETSFNPSSDPEYIPIPVDLISDISHNAQENNPQSI